VPLYVGRMVNIYDHRASSVTVNEENVHNAALSLTISDNEKLDASVFPIPQYWVRVEDVPEPLRRPWVLSFRDIARSTDVRTCISAFVPNTANGNKLPMLIQDRHGPEMLATQWPLLQANLASIAFDFVTRQKIQSTAMNWFIVEQLPFVAPARFEVTLVSLASGASTGSARTGEKSAKQHDESIADFIRTEVLALTYTAHDMAPFAHDMGYVDAAGNVLPPFVWDADDRAHRMARLDAIFMALYGLNESDAKYVLSTFPIVQRQDEAAFGRYRTRDLIIGYMQLLAAGALTHSNSSQP